jgi:hypothetical protein
MSDARRFSFKAQTIKSLCLAFTLFAGGCTTSGINTASFGASNNTTTSKVALTTGSTGNSSDGVSKILAREASSTHGRDAGINAPKNTAERGAWCRYLDANARAQSTILRSPTLAADVNDNGNGGINISYDFIDLARANLKEETARIQCQRYLASSRLATMMLVAPQSLTLAGNRAKASYLKSKRGALSSIKQKIKQHITNGDMTVQLATALMQQVELVSSTEHQARAEAQRRQSIGNLGTGSMIGLDTELENAERLLQEVDRRSRSFEAVKVSFSAGYGYQGDSGLTTNSGYGKIKLSYRLGAMSPTRHEYEDIAAEARVAALHETNRGMLWRSNEMSRAIVRALGGLMAQKKQLVRAIADARRNSVLYIKGYENEMLLPQYRGQIDSIALGAQLRGINATILDMRRIERNLRFQ